MIEGINPQSVTDAVDTHDPGYLSPTELFILFSLKNYKNIKI